MDTEKDNPNLTGDAPHEIAENKKNKTPEDICESAGNWIASKQEIKAIECDTDCAYDVDGFYQRWADHFAEREILIRCHNTSPVQNEFMF